MKVQTVFNIVLLLIVFGQFASMHFLVRAIHNINESIKTHTETLQHQSEINKSVETKLRILSERGK